MISESILTAIGTAVLGYLAFLERRLFKLQTDVSHKMDREDVEHFVDLKQAVIESILRELKDRQISMDREMSEQLKEIKEELRRLRDKH